MKFEEYMDMIQNAADPTGRNRRHIRWLSILIVILTVWLLFGSMVEEL